MKIPAGLIQIILGMHFEPAGARPLLKKLPVVRSPQPDSHAQPGRCRGPRQGRHGSATVSRLLRYQLAAGFFAGALGNEFPLAGAVVDFRLACAGVRAVRRSAIVLAGLGDTEALFLVGASFGGFREGGAGGGDADGGQGCGDQGLTFVHGKSPTEYKKKKRGVLRHRLQLKVSRPVTVESYKFCIFFLMDISTRNNSSDSTENIIKKQQ